MTSRYSHSRQHIRRTARGAVCALALAASLIHFTNTAVASDERYVVVKVKKAVTITGEDISDAMIVIVGGKIEAVGKKVDYPSDSRVIDLSELVAMPGMINPHTAIGLPNLPRSGNQSHRKVVESYEPPDDDTYAELLKAGYTILGLYAPGSGMPGQKLIQTTYLPKPRSGLKDAGMVRVEFVRSSTDRKLLKDTLKQAQAEIDKEKQAATKPAADSKPAAPTTQPAPTSQPATQPTTAPATTQPAATKPAASAPAAPKTPPHLEPWIALLKKKEGFVAQIEFARASDVIHFADAVGDKEFARSYLFAGFQIADVHNVIDHELLGKAKANVVLPPLLQNMPLTANPYNPAADLIKSGCTVSLAPAGDNVLEHRLMRERLALLVRNGLQRTDALKAVTLNAAGFLQIDKEYGSLEKDKWADLIFLDGDPLDPTSSVRRVMIRGELLPPLDDRAAKSK